MKTQKQLQEYIAQHPGWTSERIRRALHRHGVTAEQVEQARSMNPGQSAKPARIVGQSITSLIAQFDDVGKVTRAMKELSKDSYMDDDEMRRSLSINPDRWKSVCQHPALVAYRYALPKGSKHVWMHPGAQAKLTAAINLDQT